VALSTRRAPPIHRRRRDAQITVEGPALAAQRVTLLIDAGGPDARAGVEIQRRAPDGAYGLALDPTDVSPGFVQVMERRVESGRQAAAA
jgi:hypothetical protein